MAFVFKKFIFIYLFLLVIIFTSANITTDKVRKIYSKSKRIIGGYKAQVGQFPYIVSIQKVTFYINHWCGGSLLNELVILTAAHCFGNDGESFENETYFAVAGIISLTREVPTRQSRRITRTIVHPDFNPDDVSNDLSLVIVERSFDFNQFVHATKIGLSSSSIKTKLCIIAGWGLIKKDEDAEEVTSSLSYIYLNIVNVQVCRKRFSSSIGENMVCAGGEAGFDTCSGDSGSPLVCSHSVQIGVVSFGTEQCGVGAPTVFTNTCFYKDWIIRSSRVSNSSLIGFNNKFCIFYLISSLYTVFHFI